MSETMTQKAIACSPDDDVARAESRIRQHSTTRIVVTSAPGALCGLGSLSWRGVDDASAPMVRALRAISERKYEPGSGR